ncbi:MAG TPA: SRPBCC family protein [Rubrobacteraceae bacterium]|nr:SRPBCC family protein [Rubrobacteraceae bacterium]
MPQRVHESIEVQAPLEDVFSYWSNFANFSNFMQNVEEVRMTGQDTSHWKVKGPLGKSVEFDARTTEMDPSRGIGWNTVEGEVMTSGEALLEEVSPGRTRIDVTMNYADPPGGKVGEVAANVLSNPERMLREDLENFARIVERGELGGPGAQSPSR